MSAIPRTIRSISCAVVRAGRPRLPIPIGKRGRTAIESRPNADRIVIHQDRGIVAEHSRSFGRGATIYDPWHHVPALPRKPRPVQRRSVQGQGAAGRNGPVRRKLAGVDDGDRQMGMHLRRI
jgi:hypothetical protein